MMKLLFAAGLAATVKAQNNATAGCPCISYPWAGSAAFVNAAGTLDVTFAAVAEVTAVDAVAASCTGTATDGTTTCDLDAATYGSAACAAGCTDVAEVVAVTAVSAADAQTVPYPTTYGMDSCQPHDQAMSPYCADAAGAALVNAPGWCASQWCFIDVAACDVANDPSSYFHGSDPALTYSYETCSAANTFADTSHDPAACDGTHSTVTAAHCFVNGHAIADGRCPCIDTWSRADANGAWPGVTNVSLTVTLEGADVAYPWGYGMGNCAPHDFNEAPYCADAQGIVLTDAPSWCQSNWCFVDENNCNLDAEVAESCSDGGVLTPAVAAVAAVAADATASPPVVEVVEVVAVAGSCATGTYTPFSAAVVPAPSSYFHGSVPALKYSYETCQHSNTFQDTATDPQACNDQHSAVIADHCMTNGHQNAHTDCPCISWPWAGFGDFVSPAGSAADAADITLTVNFGNITGDIQYPIGYGMAACAPHDALLPPYCATADGTVLTDAPGWCLSNWCFVDAAACTGMTNSDGTAAPTDPSSYFAGSSPTLVYSYQTCAADNTFIGTVHDQTATQLTAQITYAIDITAIAAGSAARTTFETEFVAAVVAATSVPAADVVINSITAGSVVVDFTVWASAADTAAATTAFTAITPAALTIASGGAAPTVASTTTTMAAAPAPAPAPVVATPAAEPAATPAATPAAAPAPATSGATVATVMTATVAAVMALY